MRPPVNRHSGAIELQMTAMIDVVFLLLVFFLWTASFEQPEHDVSGAIALPPAGTAEAVTADTSPPPPFDEIVIRIIQPADEAMVEIRMNDRVVSDVGELTERLRQIVALGVQPPVIVYPDDQISMGDAIAVYDAVLSAGMDRVLFAAKQ